MASLRIEREWHGIAATRLTTHPQGWAATGFQSLWVWKGTDPPAELPPPPEPVLGELIADAGRVLAPPSICDLDSGSWSQADAGAALTDGLAPEAAAGFGARAAVWSADGDALVVYGEYRPPRGFSTASWSGPSARVVLATYPGDGPPASTPLWEGDRSEPREALAITGSFVAFGGRAIDVRRRADGAPAASLEAERTVARIIRIDAGEKLLAAGYADGRVVIAELPGGREVASFQAHPDEARGLAWRADGSLVTGGSDGVRTWSATGEPGASLDLGSPVASLAADPDGRGIVAVTSGLDPVVLSLTE